MPEKLLSLCISFLVIVPDLQKDSNGLHFHPALTQKGDPGRHCSPVIYVSRCMKTNLLASWRIQKDVSLRPPRGDKKKTLKSGGGRAGGRTFAQKKKGKEICLFAQLITTPLL